MIVAVDPYLIDWLDLAPPRHRRGRLDRHLVLLRRARQPPGAAEAEEDADAGVGGEAWEVHGGGFYLVQKFTVAPKTCPSAAVVQVGGTRRGFRLRALLRPLLRRRRSQPRRRRHVRVGRHRDLRSPCSGQPGSFTTLCRVIDNELVSPPCSSLVTWRPPGASASSTRIARYGCSWGRCSGRSWWRTSLRDHPGTPGLRAGETGRAWSLTRRRAQAALGAQQLPHAAGARPCSATTSRSRTGTRTMARARSPHARRSLDPPLLQPPTRRAYRGGYRPAPRRARRGRRLDQTAGR